MVDFNLIQELGTEDSTVEDMLREALGQASEADYMDEVLGDEISKFKSGEILKGMVRRAQAEFDLGLVVQYMVLVGYRTEPVRHMAVGVRRAEIRWLALARL